jgi:hypothetical protein
VGVWSAAGQETCLRKNIRIQVNQMGKQVHRDTRHLLNIRGIPSFKLSAQCTVLMLSYHNTRSPGPLALIAVRKLGLIQTGGGSLSISGPGRILDQWISSVANRSDAKVNRIARILGLRPGILGLGPDAAAKEICQILAACPLEQRNSSPSESQPKHRRLVKKCSELVRYTLPCGLTYRPTFGD